MNIYHVVMITLCLAGLIACSSGAKRDFINQCAHTENDEPICSCAWDKLNQRYSDHELHNIFSGYGKPPAHFAQDFQETELQCEGPVPAGMN